jgi:hypothetical protein
MNQSSPLPKITKGRMKFFIGAKDLSGQVIVAEIVEANDFSGALLYLECEAQNAVGEGNYRLTAVNEQLPIAESGKRIAESVAQLLEAGSTDCADSHRFFSVREVTAP